MYYILKKPNILDLKQPDGGPKRSDGCLQYIDGYLGIDENGEYAFNVNLCMGTNENGEYGFNEIQVLCPDA